MCSNVINCEPSAFFCYTQQTIDGQCIFPSPHVAFVVLLSRLLQEEVQRPLSRSLR